MQNSIDTNRILQANSEIIHVLERAKELHETLIDGLSNPIVVTDLQGRIYRINRACAELLGVEPEDAIAKRLGQFTDCEICQSLDRIRQELTPGSDTHAFESHDHERSFEWSIRIVDLAEGRQAMVALGTDTTVVRLREREQVQAEERLRIAHAVQSSFVSAQPKLDGIEVAIFYDPAEAVGGDWLETFYHGDRYVYFYLGDVTGHGFSAALVTALAGGAMDAYHNLFQENVDLVTAAQTLNYVIYRGGRLNDHVMTLAAVRLDRLTGEVTAVNCGHPFPIHIRSDKSGPVLTSPSPTIGLNPELNVVLTKLKLAPGDSLLIYSDGLTENAENLNSHFSLKRFFRGIEPTSVDQIQETILQRYRERLGNAKPQDDVCFAVIRWLGN